MIWGEVRRGTVEYFSRVSMSNDTVHSPPWVTQSSILTSGDQQIPRSFWLFAESGLSPCSLQQSAAVVSLSCGCHFCTQSPIYTHIHRQVYKVQGVAAQAYPQSTVYVMAFLTPLFILFFPHLLKSPKFPFPADNSSPKHPILNPVQSWNVFLFHLMIAPLPLGSKHEVLQHWLFLMVSHLENEAQSVLEQVW